MPRAAPEPATADNQARQTDQEQIGDQAVSRCKSRQELEDKVNWEGGPAEPIFGCGLKPEELPDGTPGDVTEAVTGLVTQAADDLETFRTWLRAPIPDLPGMICEGGTAVPTGELSLVTPRGRRDT